MGRVPPHYCNATPCHPRATHSAVMVFRDINTTICFARLSDRILESNMPTTPEIVAEKLAKFRESLIMLKQDRTTYVKSSSVVRLYDELCEYVRQSQELEGDLLDRSRAGKSKREAVPQLSPLHGPANVLTWNLVLQLANL